MGTSKTRRREKSVIPLRRLYAIADASFSNPVAVAAILFDAGVRLLQVRNKASGAGELLQQVEEILAFAPTDSVVIVNDRVDIAELAGASGVHLGQRDVPPGSARQFLKKDRIIGWSTHTVEQALEAETFPVDYIAVGPVFPTSTKQNADPVVGVDGLAAICRAVHKPVVAIGGIQLENAGQVFDAGAQSIAVIRDLLSAPDVRTRARDWIRAVGH
jgi:thiamine-phosphate pyrophosphorylase